MFNTTKYFINIGAKIRYIDDIKCIATHEQNIDLFITALKLGASYNNEFPQAAVAERLFYDGEFDLANSVGGIFEAADVLKAIMACRQQQFTHQTDIHFLFYN